MSSASSFSSAPSSSSRTASQQPCTYTTDYGFHNVSTLCPRCAAGAPVGMSVSEMLGAVRKCVRSAEVASLANAREEGSESASDCSSFSGE